jgi:hypothetical protein
MLKKRMGVAGGKWREERKGREETFVISISISPLPNHFVIEDFTI